jgi:hypothetical protein
MVKREKRSEKGKDETNFDLYDAMAQGVRKMMLLADWLEIE